MPRFDTVMVPPWNSCGCNLPSRALAANSLIALLISINPLRSACVTIGVIKPLSVATATEHSTESYLFNKNSQLIIDFSMKKFKKLKTYCRMKLPCHAEFASGTFFDAKAVALTTKSLNDNLTPSFSNCLLNSARTFES